MTTTFGVTAAGFTTPSVQDLLALIEADQLAEVSSTLDVSADSPFGQNNGIFAFYLAQAWEALGGTYSGFDPDKAEAVLLTMLSKLTGTPRAGATASTAHCTVGADPGTTLIAGTHFASVSGKPDVKFTPAANFTATTSSTLGVLFVSEKTGAVQATPGQLSVIATPVVGWNSIVNTDISLGTLVATDEQLRVTRQQELTQSGSSSTDAIYAALIALFEGRFGTSVAPFNNTKDSVDANGLPPHSFEMVVWDHSGSVDADVIAQTIWNSKPAGIESFGTSTGTAIDKTGKSQLVHFTRATEVPIFMAFTLVHRDGFVDNATFANGVVANCTQGIQLFDGNGVLTETVLAPFATGVTVTLYDLTLATQGLGAKVTALTFGTTASPVASVDVPLTVRQVATFSLANITVSP